MLLRNWQHLLFNDSQLLLMRSCIPLSRFHCIVTEKLTTLAVEWFSIVVDEGASSFKQVHCIVTEKLTTLAVERFSIVVDEVSCFKHVPLYCCWETDNICLLFSDCQLLMRMVILCWMCSVECHIQASCHLWIEFKTTGIAADVDTSACATCKACDCTLFVLKYSSSETLRLWNWPKLDWNERYGMHNAHK